ncbi:MAG TPA: type II secretion system protein [Planctomycetota bacterium]|nr:type II secretion system protein [Planctomycetota bacterium]
MTRARARQAGFTLVELLIVVVILAILAAVVIPQINNASAEAKESALRASLATVRQAISLYRVQHAEIYPGMGGWDEFVTQLTTGTDQAGNPGTKYGPYLRTGFPNNPVTDTADGTAVATMPATAPGGTAWIYSTDVGELRANVAGAAPSGTDFFDL